MIVTYDRQNMFIIQATWNQTPNLGSLVSFCTKCPIATGHLKALVACLWSNTTVVIGGLLYGGFPFSQSSAEKLFSNEWNRLFCNSILLQRLLKMFKSRLAILLARFHINPCRNFLNFQKNKKTSLANKIFENFERNVIFIDDEKPAKSY